MLAGCEVLRPGMGLDPGPGEPLQLPAQWSDAAAGLGAGQRSALLGWWLRFDDPLLASLVTRALQANTSVRGAQAALQQAQALRQGVAAALMPTLGGSASVQRSWTGEHSSGNQLGLGLNGQWLPDVWGVGRFKLDASDAAVLASSATLGDVQVQLAAEVALDYILLRAAQARASLAADNLGRQQDTLQLTRWRQQAGLVTQLDVAQARTVVAQTEATLPLLATAIGQARHALAVLCGQAPVPVDAGLAGQLAADPLATQAPVPQASAALGLGVPADALRQRADVRAAEFQVRAALARVGQAGAERWPSFAISGTLGSSAVTVAALGHPAALLGTVLASVSLPLIDGGAARTQLLAQQAALLQARQVYRAAVLTALKDVEDALLSLRDDGQRLLSLQVAAESATLAAGLARQRYSGGLVDILTVLDTERSLLSLQDSVVSATADVGGDQVRLFKALGGGWADRPGDSLPLPAVMPAPGVQAVGAAR